MLSDNNLIIYNINNNLSSVLYSNAETLNNILLKITTSIERNEIYQDIDITNLINIRNEMLETLKLSYNNGHIIFFTDTNNPIIENPTYNKFNLKPYTLYFLLNVNFNNASLLVQFLSLVPGSIVSNNLILLFWTDFSHLFSSLDDLITNKPININNAIDNVKLFKKNVKTYQIILENIRAYVFQMQFNLSTNITNTTNTVNTTNTTNTTNDITQQFVILETNNIDIINNDIKLSQILFQNITTISDVMNGLFLNLNGDGDGDMNYENLLTIKNDMISTLLQFSNSGYIKFYANTSNLTSDNISQITLAKFNMENNIIYFYLNINPNNIDIINQVVLLDSSIIFFGNYLLFYTIDLNLLFETIDYLYSVRPLNINNKIVIIYDYLELIKLFQVSLENIIKYALSLQYIDNIIGGSTGGGGTIGGGESTIIIQNITQKISTELSNLKCNSLKIKNKLYLKIFLTISEKLYTCLSYTNYQSSGFITDFLKYNSITNINTNELPDKFLYDAIYEYYRQNNIIYLKILNDVYFRKKNTNYKIVNGLELIDELNTFKYLREIYFSDSNIIDLLLDIKNLLNEIYDGLVIKYLDNKIYFYEIIKDYNLITKNITRKNKINLIQIIDISYFFSINNNCIDVKDIWEIYYSPSQNLVLQQKFKLLINSIEKLLTNLFYGCGCKSTIQNLC